MTHRIKTLTLEDRMRFFWLVVTVFIGALILYVYGVNATARHVALRQELEHKVVEANAEIATLEYSYLALQNDITMERAYAYGFTEVKKPLYVSRAANTGSLTFNR